MRRDIIKKYKLYQVDSFTKEKFRGNPAGVVTNADGLNETDMLKIAREMNNSETAFIFSEHSGDYDVEVRFFTPTIEVPICGHATIAAHYMRAITENLESGRVMQKTGAGILPVDIIKTGDDYSIVMTQGTPTVGEPLSDEIQDRIVSSLGIEKSDLREDCPIVIASTGHSKVMIGIKSEGVLHNLEPNLDELIKISKLIRCNGYYVFTLSPGAEILAHGRMFSPAIGVKEDPVTGNANGPLGAYMVHYGICKELQGENEFDFTIMQGEAIGRAGSMKVHVDIEDGVPKLVQLTGEAVIVFETEIEL